MKNDHFSCKLVNIYMNLIKEDLQWGIETFNCFVTVEYILIVCQHQRLSHVSHFSLYIVFI